MVDEPANLDDAIRQVARILRDANRVLFVTGAGISADSGLPTYRGVGVLTHVSSAVVIRYNDTSLDRFPRWPAGRLKRGAPGGACGAEDSG